jgi:hypothetical protein
MKLTEISTQALTESLDEQNDTGYATADLVSVIQEHQAGNWSAELTGEDLDALLESLIGSGTD